MSLFFPDIPMFWRGLGTAIGVTLMLISAGLSLWIWRQRRTPIADARPAADLEPIIDPEAWPSEAEVREECAAHGWPREEPYLTDARDHLIFEREFNELAARRSQ